MNSRALKTLNAILFFANKEKSKSINRLKLMKLLWLSDRIHLNKFGRLILKDKYCALPNGPVPSSALNYSNYSQEDFFDVSSFNIKAKADANHDFFSKSDLKVMDQVWEKFGSMSQFELKDFSHKFPEWLRYKTELEDKYSPKSYPIILDDFFIHPEGESLNVDLSSKEISSSKEYYHTHKAIQSYLNS